MISAMDWARSANMRAISASGGDGAEGGFGAGVEEDAADAVAEGGAAGLAEGDDLVAFGLKRGGEAAELGGFAGAVETFEGDEISARHSLQLTADGSDDITRGRRVDCMAGCRRCAPMGLGPQRKSRDWGAYDLYLSCNVVPLLLIGGVFAVLASSNVAGAERVAGYGQHGEARQS